MTNKSIWNRSKKEFSGYGKDINQTKIKTKFEYATEWKIPSMQPTKIEKEGIKNISDVRHAYVDINYSLIHSNELNKCYVIY